MKLCLSAALFSALFFTSCTQFFAPEGWPLEVSPQREAVKHMSDHVKFTGGNTKLTKQEKALLTFLDDKANVADAIGERNAEGSHQWSTAEVYLVEPGLHVSVICENGYQQKAVYFHYAKAEKTWYRVKNLEPDHSKGVPAVLVR